MDFKTLFLKTALILLLTSNATADSGVSDGGGDEWIGGTIWNCDSYSEGKSIHISSAVDGAVFPSADLKMSWMKKYGTPAKYDTYMSVGMGTTVGPQMVDNGTNLLARYMLSDHFVYTKDNDVVFERLQSITLDIHMHPSEGKERFVEGAFYPATVEFVNPETEKVVSQELECKIVRIEETED